MPAMEGATSAPTASPSFDYNAATGEDLFIGISGLIGAGKTTLATALGKELGLPVHYEPVIDNVYLEDFYQDMGKYSFQLQVYLLNKRFKQQQQIIWQDKGGVQDRTIYEDSVFASMLFESGHLDARDYQTYLELFKNMSNFMRRPNLIVHLDLTPEESHRRIAMRSRDCESGVSLEYLRGLHAAYEKFITEIARVIPVIKVDYNEFRTVEEMAAAIKLEYSRIANIRSVGFGGVPKTAQAAAAAAAAANAEASASASVGMTAADMDLSRPSPAKAAKKNAAAAAAAAAGGGENPQGQSPVTVKQATETGKVMAADAPLAGLEDAARELRL